MKKLTIGISSFLAGALLMTGVSSFASNGLQKIAANINNTIFLKLNGEKVDNEYPIITYAGRTYVYLKEVGNLVGASVEWNDEERSVEILTEPQSSQTPQPTNTVDSDYVDRGTSQFIETVDGKISVDVYDFTISTPTGDELKRFPSTTKVIDYKIRVFVDEEYDVNSNSPVNFYYTFNDEGSTDVAFPINYFHRTDGEKYFKRGENFYQLRYFSTSNVTPTDYKLKNKEYPEKITIFHWDVNL
jgi:hypothetical protein